MVENIKNIKKTWGDIGVEYFHPRVVAMLFLGFSAGIPILLIFSSLGLWLREAGIDRSTVTMFSWAALPYSFKFIWAPIVDRMSLPILTGLIGRRRSWLLFAQLLIVVSILWMAMIDPSIGEMTLLSMAAATVLLGFSSATQDIVIDAYRIEAAHSDVQAVTSSTYIAGYRIGMIVAGAGVLYLASHWGSTADHYEYKAWLWSYQAMALVMLIGVVTTLVIPEPDRFKQMDQHLSVGYLLVALMMVFSASELTFAVIESQNLYYQAFIWLVRALFIGVTLSLVVKLINRQDKRGYYSHSGFDGVAILLLAMTYLLLLMSIAVQQHWVGSDYSSFIDKLWFGLIAVVVIYIAFYIRHRVQGVVIEEKAEESDYSTNDYISFFMMFIFSVLGFIALYVMTSPLVDRLSAVSWYGSSAIYTFVADSLMAIPDWIAGLKESVKEFSGNKNLSSFAVGSLRLVMALSVAIGIAYFMTKAKMVNTEMVVKTYVAPIDDFFKRFGLGLAILLLALIGLYRISDIVLGVIANVFYQDLGFTKVQIASIVKTFGLFMTIAGGFIGGVLALRFGVMKILFLGALLTVITNLLFVMLAKLGIAEPQMLYLVISADNLTAGLASAAFIAFLSSLTNIQFTAVQYAIFSSLMSLLPKIIGGSSGTIVDSFCPEKIGGLNHCMAGYESFFLIASLMGVPVLILVWLASKYLSLAEFKLKSY